LHEKKSVLIRKREDQMQQGEWLFHEVTKNRPDPRRLGYLALLGINDADASTIHKIRYAKAYLAYITREEKEINKPAGGLGFLSGVDSQKRQKKVNDALTGQFSTRLLIHPWHMELIWAYEATHEDLHPFHQKWLRSPRQNKSGQSWEEQEAIVAKFPFRRPNQ
jgi:hypothetical protein